MAIVRGRCSNFDYCMVAERRIVLDVDVGAGAAFICPECGRALGAPPSASRNGGRRFALVLGAAILLLGGGLYGAAMLQPGPGYHARLPPWLDPALQTHEAEAPPVPVATAVAAPPAAMPAAPRDMKPPQVPPVPPRPNQPALSESHQVVLGSAALLPLMVTVANRLAAPPPVAPAPAAPPKITYVVPSHLTLPTNRPATTQDGVYGQYHDLVDGNRRLAAGVHFAPHAIGLDAAGMRELDRIVQTVTAAGAQTGHVIVVGFSDNDGSRPHSLDLARRRAAVVAAVLAQRGVKVAQSAAFGADLPVAGNSTESGRARNRRVEVFLQP